MVKKETGQVIIILLLVMVVALAVGLSVVGRSVTEISTSTKTEDSSKAFSAAEAGIEKAFKESPDIGNGTTGGIPETTLDNQSSFQTDWKPNIPQGNLALEYPPIGKESFAQFWLASPQDGSRFYTSNQIDVYFGKVDSESDPPAIKINLISQDGVVIKNTAHFIDSYGGTAERTRNAGFLGCGALKPVGIQTNTSDSPEKLFYCKATISFTNTGSTFPILARVRILYSNISHPIALKPSSGSPLPPQVRIFKSIGKAGSTQRTLQLFQQKSVMPHLFDYALFSAKDLTK